MTVLWIIVALVVFAALFFIFAPQLFGYRNKGVQEANELKQSAKNAIDKVAHEINDFGHRL